MKRLLLALAVLAVMGWAGSTALADHGGRGRHPGFPGPHGVQVVPYGAYYGPHNLYYRVQPHVRSRHVCHPGCRCGRVVPYSTLRPYYPLPYLANPYLSGPGVSFGIYGPYGPYGGGFYFGF
jgi:hypothetical protein